MHPIFGFIYKNWKNGLKPVIFLLVSSSIALIYPQIPRLAIDVALKKQDYRYLFYLSLVFLILVIFQRIFSYLNEITFFKFQKATILNIQKELLRKVFSYPLEFFDKKHSGYLLGRIRGDVSGLSYIFSEGLVESFMDLIKFIGVLIILLNMNTRLAFISIAIMPFLVYKIVNSRKEIKRVNEKILEENARLEKELSDTLQGVEVLKSFSKEEEGLKRSYSALQNYQKIEVERNVIFSGYRNIVDLIFHLGEVLLLYFGVREVLAGRLTVGGYIAFNGYLMILYGPLKNLSYLSIYLDYAGRSYQRIRELLSILPEDNGELELQGIVEIEARDVAFSYEGNEKLLDNVNFKIRRGERLLIEGESGSGKSTLVKLLLGLYEIQEGTIYFNGVELRKINKKKLRESVGYVSQNIFLFNKSLRENLLLGRMDTSDERLIDILELCGLRDSFKGDNENGVLDMEVSEKGLNFSGGERQRLALARALIKDPDVIVLDEATANLDMETERELEKLILKKFSERIIIKISHRPESLEGWKVIKMKK